MRAIVELATSDSITRTAPRSAGSPLGWRPESVLNSLRARPVTTAKVLVTMNGRVEYMAARDGLDLEGLLATILSIGNAFSAERRRAFNRPAAKARTSSDTEQINLERSDELP